MLCLICIFWNISPAELLDSTESVPLVSTVPVAVSPGSVPDVPTFDVPLSAVPVPVLVLPGLLVFPVLIPFLVDLEGYYELFPAPSAKSWLRSQGKWRC